MSLLTLPTQGSQVERPNVPAFPQSPVADSRQQLVRYNGISATVASPSELTAIDLVVNPDQYTIAIVCAMAHEFDPIRALFDAGASCTYRGSPNDQNMYVVGRFTGHHTVLMMPGDKGELDAGMCTQRLRDHFQKIELTLLVGICGTMSRNNEAEESIYLGDVIVGTSVWRYLHDARSSQLPSGGVTPELRNVMTERASQRVQQLGNLLKTEDFRKEIIGCSFSYLRFLQGREGGDKYKYPGRKSDGLPPDKLFKSDCLHQHRSLYLQCSCADPAKSNCAGAKDTPCKDLGCEEDGIERVRPRTEVPPKPNIHVGVIASADVVMRARSEFAADFKTHKILGVDMEGGGVSKATDCIVIKGAVDYADMHKNKDFAFYAAAAAASVAKAFLLKLYPKSIDPASPQRPHSYSAAATHNHDYNQDATDVECMKALRLTNPSIDLMRIQRAKGEVVGGTCEWISKQKEYAAWYGGGNPQTLLLVGDPGIGKTMLTVFLVEKLKVELKETNHTLAYFFCDNKDAARNTATAILRGLLRQLSRQRRLFKLIKNEFNQRGKSLFDDFDALCRVFLDILEDPDTGQVYLLIDALDECEKSSRESIVWFLAVLREKRVQTKLLITCRTHYQIENQFPERLFINRDKVKDDLSTYIRKAVRKLATVHQYSDYSESLEKEVINDLWEKSDGTFLWVSLVLHDLYEAGSDVELVRKTLETLPRTLVEVYDRILRQIERRYTDEAKFVLQWVAVARRPLTVDELDMAYDLWSEKRRGNKVPKRDPRTKIYKTCEPLVYVDHKNKTVNLVHQSAKDYLLSDNRRSSMVIFRVFALPMILWAGLGGHYITFFALSATTLFMTIPFESFLSPSSFASAIGDILNPNITISRYRVVPEEANLLLFNVCWEYINTRAPEKLPKMVQWNNGKGLTRYADEEWLEHALAASPASITEVVWVSDNLDELPTLRENWLLGAAREGHKAVVQLLVDKGADVTAKNNDGLTALHLAARNRHWAVVQLLLEKRAGIFRKEFGDSIEDGTIIKLLLAKELKTDNPYMPHEDKWHRRIEQSQKGRDDMGGEWLLRWGFFGFVWSLFRPGKRWPPQKLTLFLDRWLGLHLHFGEFRISEHYLLDWGPTILGVLLYVALYEPHPRMWSRFWRLWWWERYRRGVFFGECFQSMHSLLRWFSRSLLSMAVERGYDTIARLLLEKGPKPDFWDSSGRTPLSLAAERGHDTIARLLLEKGAKPDFMDISGVTPLSWAARMGHESAVQLFLVQEGVDVNSKDKDDDTPLSNAAASGHAGIVKLFLMTERVDLNVKNSDNQTPLLLAARNGHEAVVKLLLEKGADVNTKDTDGGTPLWWAALRGHKAVVELQLEKSDFAS